LRAAAQAPTAAQKGATSGSSGCAAPDADAGAAVVKRFQLINDAAADDALVYPRVQGRHVEGNTVEVDCGGGARLWLLFTTPAARGSGRRRGSFGAREQDRWRALRAATPRTISLSSTAWSGKEKEKERSRRRCARRDIACTLVHSDV